MLFSLFSPALALAAEGGSSDRYVTVSVEKFTLGQGYVVEPVRVPFEEGDNAAAVIMALLGEDARHTGSIDSAFYLSKVHNPSDAAVDIPTHIVDAAGGAGAIGDRAEADWLGEFDYTSMSGWMYAVNDQFPNVGASDRTVAQGDVIRWQFTVYGFGADLRGELAGSPELADKDALTAEVAALNSSPEQAELLADPAVQAAYDDAYAALTDMASSQSDVDAARSALEEALAASEDEGSGEPQPAYDVTFTVAPRTVTLDVYDADDHRVDIGAATPDTFNVYTAALPAGTYRYSGVDQEGNRVGGGELKVTDEANQAFALRQLKLRANNSGWEADEDYTVRIGQDSPSDTSLTLGDKAEAGHYPALVVTGHTYFYAFEPSAARVQEGYVALDGSVTVTLAGSAQNVRGAIPLSRETSFAVPEDATLFVGRKIKHFVSFEEIEPLGSALEDGKRIYSYKLMNGQTYNYRVSQPGKLTTVGTFQASEANAAMEVTSAQLDVQSPQAILNRGTYLEGNLYLNLDTQHHLKLAAPGDEFQLLTLRNWQALIEGINNYFFEPDYHYEIVSGDDVIEIAAGEPGSYSTIRALQEGTAIVKVTYDALKVNGSMYIQDADDAFSAIWPENVGLFAVTVGQPETDIVTGIESNKARNEAANAGKTGNEVMNLQNGAFDADIDSVYYLAGEPGAAYTFTPSAGSEVSVLYPEIDHAAGTVSYEGGAFSREHVTAHPDGSVDILLKEGRNLVKVEKDGLAEYQAMIARPLQVTLDNVSRPGEAIGAGDEVQAVFEGLSFPANKLSGIYNFNAQLRFAAGPDEELITGLARQYNIATQANSLTFQVPEQLDEDGYSLYDGHIKLGFYGSPIGDHRNIDPAVGANPNFTASMREGYYSVFPEIVVVAADEPVPADTAALQQAIEQAERALQSVVVSADGADVHPSDVWVTEDVYGQLVQAMESAQALIADETASQDEVDAKVLALDQSRAALEAAQQPGHKAPLTGVTEQLDEHLAYLAASVSSPVFGTLGGEWSVLALARAGADVPDGYFASYYDSVAHEVAQFMPATANKAEGLLDRNRGTEHSRLILALTALGEDIHDVAGYDISAALADFDYVTKQGINGPIFALLALDSHDYALPSADGVDNPTTREKMVDYILEREIATGGWSLAGAADPDMTAMALQALAPYDASDEAVGAAVDRAVAWLSSAQNGNGGYASWGVENVQSVAQVVVALTALDIDPHTDARFIKNGRSAVDNLLTFAAPGGGFVHPKGGSVNGMATDQGTYALVAFDRFLKGETALYEMSDVVLKEAEPDDVIALPGDEPSIVVPDDGLDYTIRVTEADRDKSVSIQLPEQSQARAFIELPANVELPHLEIVRGGVVAAFPQGLRMETESTTGLELMTAKNRQDADMRAKLVGILGADRELDGVQAFFTMGGSEPVRFANGFVALTFAGMAGKEAAFIQNGEMAVIQKFADDEAGAASGLSEYAYEAGGALVVKTSHFTDFVLYQTTAVEEEDDGTPPGEDDGEEPGTQRPTIRLSIDKLTIDKGYVLSPTTVSFTTGETVWDVLQRELDARDIDYDYTFSEEYGSVYIESIAGDGEFDHGSGSGWMYNVNGDYPQYGASQYELEPGDRVQWRYTTNLGEDLGEDPAEWEDDSDSEDGDSGAGGGDPDRGGDSPGTVFPETPTDGTDESGDADTGESSEKLVLTELYTDADRISSWAYESIRAATVRGFVEGYQGRVNPKDEITRAEFAKLLVEVFELKGAGGSRTPFRDVQTQDWFYSYVNAAHATGIVTGYGDRFRPSAAITREEMAVMLARALDLAPADSASSYADQDLIAAWALPNVQRLAELELMIGSGDRFLPKDAATREMAFVVAMRAYHYKETRE
ncbi:DUF4430 domain-containing protein [Paenibacillus sp. IB182496]|uniref:DUF4430 domain-containing protein n=1 Tax=Paenibacillus sabuli TaxID=2772509 RepID=A0A927BWP2_9BACL|nr:DUF4430 domain-containing protein [Paenibacillus sabuli]MBD2846834.1 DUF4430 domain-containing protein [Paenibacillus sabuli]